jgi:iron complex transport system ATP-binding protein
MSRIELDHVSVRRGQRCVLKDISLTVEQGERVALIGPNGSGKTTLLRAILGIAPVALGRVLLDGLAVEQLTPLQRAAKIAWLPQQALGDEPITTVEFVQVARYRFQETRQAAHAAALRALARVDAEDWASRLVTQLSGGEQQRVALAALIAQDSETVLADEPANHLDPAQQGVVWQLLGRIAAAGTMIVVTHDVNWLHWLGDSSRTRIVALKQGQLCFDVHADSLALPTLLSDLYEIPLSALECGHRRLLFAVEPGGAES